MDNGISLEILIIAMILRNYIHVLLLYTIAIHRNISMSYLCTNMYVNVYAAIRFV